MVEEEAVEATESMHGLLHHALHAPEENRTLRTLLACSRQVRDFQNVALPALQAPCHR